MRELAGTDPRRICWIAGVDRSLVKAGQKRQRVRAKRGPMPGSAQSGGSGKRQAERCGGFEIDLPQYRLIDSAEYHHSKLLGGLSCRVLSKLLQ